MFEVAEIAAALEAPAYRYDLEWVRTSLALRRLGRPEEIRADARVRLAYLVEVVLASAPHWTDGTGIDIVQSAAQAAELLADTATVADARGRHALHAALLYELADMPSLAAATRPTTRGGLLASYFGRSGAFGALTDAGNADGFAQPTVADEVSHLGDLALSADAYALGLLQQGRAQPSERYFSDALSSLAEEVNIGCSVTELRAMSATVSRRAARAAVSWCASEMWPLLRKLKFPAELFPAQEEALRRGLLDDSHDAWGFAAPTGAGKTFLARLLLLKELEGESDARALYVVPSKALVNEVTRDLQMALEPIRIRVGAVTPQLTDLDAPGDHQLADVAVAVLTPEKADLLLRLGADFLDQTKLVVVDEAHHIENGTRGVLLEFFLWRLRRLLPHVRIVFLSALAPNILELAKWLGRNPDAAVSDRRSTRMRVGVYRIENGSGRIDYVDGTSIEVVQPAATGKRASLVQLAHHVSSAGPVLVVANGRGECETLAAEMFELLKERGAVRKLTTEQLSSAPAQRLDSRLEREMYSDIQLRKLFPVRIVYHHAGLPPRVRQAVEDAIRKNLVDFVFATTTLADGVNFPFSTVIVQSLALREPPEKGRPSRYAPVTPRTFWNIAGRAGRPGYDREGQVLLFEPSLGLDRVNLTLDPYVTPSWRKLAPVQSALATSLRDLRVELEKGSIHRDALRTVALAEDLPRRVRGTLNLVRVSLVHARTIHEKITPEVLVDGSFGLRDATADERRFALDVFSEQLDLVNEFLASDQSLTVDLVAELGLSIGTLAELRDYVRSLEDWQIGAFSHLFYGGQLNPEQAKYIVGPVAKRMAELEGRRLGAFLSETILHWLQGLPLAEAPRPGRGGKLEDLVTVIYTQVQYLLPWGLYAFDRLVDGEATRRSIPYENQVKNLAYLADAGVPSFDALKLVNHDFERVDSTRLAAEYKRQGGAALGVDVLSWAAHLPKPALEHIVRGRDNRRIDYDLHELAAALKA
jgi:superfamily II DNA/RNA helicase